MARFSEKDDIVRVQSNIRDEIDKDRQRRYQREQKKSDEMEEALGQLSNFNYLPIDYTSGLIRKQFNPPVIPDYSYLLTEARLKVVNKYNTPIVIQLIFGLICVIISLAFPNSFVPVIGAAGLVACALSLYKDLRKRQQRIDRALSAARTQIDTLIKEVRDTIERARKSFDEVEDIRIEMIERILSGDAGAVFTRIEEAFATMQLPFYLRCTVDYYGTEPLLTLHLPDNLIIPAKIVSLSSASQINYLEKSPFEINRQHSEVLAGTAISIATLLYSCIPTLNTLYIQGLFDKWNEEEYHFSLKLTREAIIDATSCQKGLDAFHKLGAEFEVKTSGSFTPIRPIFPEWWETVPREKIRTVTLACQQTSSNI